MPNGYPPSGLQTMEDSELSGIDRKELEQAVDTELMRRNAAVASPPQPDRRGLAVQWGWLQERHEAWRGKYWAECRALYTGGPRLLEDAKVMDRLFPRHLNEDESVYKMRRERSHYYAYAGTICDHLLAGLDSDPLRVSFGEQDGETGKFEGDPWWDAFVADVTSEGDLAEDGEERDEDNEGGCTLHNFSIEVLRELLQTGHTWVSADLPRASEDEAATGAAAADVYLCLHPAESVIDWEMGGNGKLSWVLTLTTEKRRASLSQKRRIVTHTYTLWTAEDWTRYVVDYDPDRPLPPEHVVEVDDGDRHGFGRVPFEHVTIHEGLWAMAKMHSIAREHFNKRCAMSWAEYKSLYALLYEFQGPEDGTATAPTSEAQQDPGRATNQVRGQGYTQIRGKDDDARYVGPDPAVFSAARESCNDAMREMHRVMMAMALSANMDSKALNRSADSKDSDEGATKVLLEAFGKLIRRLSRRFLALVAAGKAAKVPPAQVQGLDHFDVQGVSASIEQAVELFAGVPILSQTFKALYLSNLYCKAIGDQLTEDQRKSIVDETEESAEQQDSAEDLIASGGMLPGLGGAVGKNPGPPKPGAPPRPGAKPAAAPPRKSAAG